MVFVERHFFLIGTIDITYIFLFILFICNDSKQIHLGLCFQGTELTVPTIFDLIFCWFSQSVNLLHHLGHTQQIAWVTIFSYW